MTSRLDVDRFCRVLARDAADAGRMVGIAAVPRDVTKRFDEMKSLRQRLREAMPGAQLK